MICRICLKDGPAGLNIFAESGCELNIFATISKHFWFEPKIDDPISTTVCTECWSQLDTFHRFYITVEEAHRLLAARFSVKSETLADLGSFPDGMPVSAELGDEVKFADVKADDSFVNFESIETGCKNEGEGEEAVLAANDEDKIHIDEVENVDDDDDDDDDDEFQADDYLKSDSDDDSSDEDEVETTKVKRRRTTKSTPKPVSADEESPTKTTKRKVGRPRKTETKKETKSYKKADTSPKKEDSNYRKLSIEYDEIISKYMKLHCEVCRMEMPTFAGIKSHSREVHKTKGYVLCCNKKLYKRALLVDHIKKHIDPEHFKCPECNKVLADKQCLKNHMMLMHKSEDEKHYPCEHCPRKFAKRYMLAQHKAVHASIEERNRFCDLCGKGFPSESTLSSHKKYVHTKAYGKMCHICAKVIRGKTAFDKHQLEHTGVKLPEVQCEKCGSWLKDKYSLQKHMRRHNDEGITHVCTLCGKVAPNQSALRSHFRYVHAATRTYKCSVCDKAFKKPLNLKEHMTTHTGEVLYSCPHCPKTFNSNANMHSHRKKVHRKEWEETRKLKKCKKDPGNSTATAGDDDIDGYDTTEETSENNTSFPNGSLLYPIATEENIV